MIFTTVEQQKEKLIEYIQREFNITVEPHDEEDYEENDWYEHKTRSIHYWEYEDVREQLTMIVHEFGHALLAHDEEWYEKYYGHVRNHPWRHDPKTWYEIILKEEHDAWDAAMKVMDKLGFGEHGEFFHEVTQKCLKLYYDAEMMYYLEHTRLCEERREEMAKRQKRKKRN